MHIRFRVMLSVCVFLSVLSCKNTSDASQEVTEPAVKTFSSSDSEHNSRNALDWHGIYVGKIPCVECDGILTMVTLIPNDHYQIQRIYMGKNEKILTEAGTMEWSDDGSEVVLNGNADLNKTRFRIEENSIRQLDRMGEPIPEKLSGEYTLEKTADGLINKYWKLTHLLGRKVLMPEGSGREPHITLKYMHNQVSGHTGCNTVGGTYFLKSGNQIIFSKMMTTAMACPDMTVEAKFLDVLNQVDNYVVRGDTLQLSKARMAPLARFEAVYFE